MEIADIKIRYIIECTNGNQTEDFTIEEIESGMVKNVQEGYHRDGLGPTGQIISRELITNDSQGRT